MILDNEAHRAHLMDVLRNVNVPGALVPLHAEIMREVEQATIQPTGDPVEAANL